LRSKSRKKMSPSKECFAAAGGKTPFNTNFVKQKNISYVRH
jgi:hypothetical protein